VRLLALIEGTEYQVLHGPLDVDVGGVRYDSRRINPGDLFVCIRGFALDGHDFLPTAWAAGAVAALVERIDLPESVLRGGTVVRVSDSRKGLALTASRFYDHPSRRLTLVGVTGTNGKTTTTYLIESLLQRAGHQVGLVGTIAYRCEGIEMDAARTTPEASDLQELLARMVLLRATST
jgi:UDP-N-acetylmuramoyl-L-alanyl-D-glutamate--2,6-diaminopimelate ligase